MARLNVQFPGTCAVLLNGEPHGQTNRVIRIEPGRYRVALQGEATDPAFHKIPVRSSRSRSQRT